MAKKISCIILTLILTAVSAYSKAQRCGVVKNWTRSAYSGGAQTWGIAPDSNGFCWFANQNGLLKHSRAGWEINEFDYDLRSVAVSKTDGRLYTGGVNRIGYYKILSSGISVYCDLTDSLPDNIKSGFGNVWYIHQIDNTIFFCADNLIIKYYADKFRIIGLPSRINYSRVIGGILYVATQTGLYMLRGDVFTKCRAELPDENLRIRGLIASGDAVLIVTASDGIFYYDGLICKPYHTDADDYICRNEVFCIADNDKYIAAGTIRGGIALIDKQNLTAGYYSESNGLQNNTVLSTAFDLDGNLWAGLDNGIDKIYLNSVFSNLYVPNNRIGTGYSALFFNNILYLGTNRGLYAVENPFNPDAFNNIREIPATGGQVWSLVNYNNQLFCLHDRGIFSVTDFNARQIGNIKGVWGLGHIPGSDFFLAGTYDELYAMKKDHSGKYVFTVLEGVTGSFRDIIYVGNNEFWLHTHNNPDLIKIKIDTTNVKILSSKFYNSSKGLVIDKTLRLTKIGNTLYAVSDKGIMKYDSIRDSFVFADPAKGIDSHISYNYLTYYNDITIASGPGRITVSSSKFQEIIPFTGIFIDPVRLMESVCQFDSMRFIIPGYNGFSLMDLNKVSVQENRSDFIINKVEITYPEDSVIFLAGNKKKFVPQIEYSRASMRFYYADENPNSLYSFRLGNNSAWSLPSKISYKEYTGLNEGDYTFYVREYNSGVITGEDSFSFVVLSPWYRTYYALSAYIVLIYITLYFLYKIINYRLLKAKKIMEVEKQRELQKKDLSHKAENDKKERLIADLEREKLENELNHKTRELADMMLNLSGKNEILSELKSDISDIFSKVDKNPINEIKQKMLDFNYKIENNIQNDNLFQKFEKQFDLLHNDFIHKLQNQHPELSQNERLLCAYLRMELSTKEIAQLLNLSVRGVETMRYRLKKKLSGNKQEDLAEYLKKLEQL